MSESPSVVGKDPPLKKDQVLRTSESTGGNLGRAKVLKFPSAKYLNPTMLYPGSDGDVTDRKAFPTIVINKK